MEVLSLTKAIAIKVKKYEKIEKYSIDQIKVGDRLNEEKQNEWEFLTFLALESEYVCTY